MTFHLKNMPYFEEEGFAYAGADSLTVGAAEKGLLLLEQSALKQFPYLVAQGS